MAKYKVVSGIMQGLIFNGHPVNIGGESRIWNDDSMGQAFPSENCIKVESESYSGRLEGLKTKDGHKYTGVYYDEEGIRWYIVEDEKGFPYETQENPPAEVIDLRSHAELLQVIIPNDSRIYNRMRPDGTFPSLDKFFNRD